MSLPRAALLSFGMVQGRKRAVKRGERTKESKRRKASLSERARST